MMFARQPTELAILRLRQLEARTGIARSTIYDRMNPRSPRFDAAFPKPIKLGPNGTAVGWLAHEVDAWILSRVNATREEVTD